jgi:methylenetetrahydrofolate dehydrogenase (NADP+) / methenyltetrahydrofolate cyclohydrolase
VMRMLDEYEIPLEGARAVVIGRSAIVGKPMAHLLLQRNATVTICHSRTQELERHTLDADVLVAAVGRTHLVSADMVKAGATVIDVGMNRDESSRKVLGDVDPGAMERAAYMTPVPGGVGPMTIAMVLQNTVTAARLRRVGAIAEAKN